MRPLLPYSLRQEMRAIKVLGLPSYIYSTFFYRPHMRWLHARGGHGFDTYPHNPIEFKVCSWCGYREQRQTAATTPAMRISLKGDAHE